MIHPDKSLDTDNQPAEFWVGIEQFNQGDYYACHDTLEAIWMDAHTYNQAFYQGILQIAVGLYHLTNLNWRGAAILLGEGRQRLDGYGDMHGGIHVTHLVNQATDWLTALQETGPDGVNQLAATLNPSSKTKPYALANGDTLSSPKIQLAMCP